MQSITIKMIKNRVDQINRLMGVSIDMHKPYKISGSYVVNIGHYHITQFNSSYGLEKIVNIMGGTTDISPRLTKRELYYFCNAYLKGIEDYSYKSNGYLKTIDKANKKNNDLVDAHRLLKAENQFHKDCADQYKKSARVLQSKVNTYEADIDQANRKKLRSANDLKGSTKLF
jgi:hypothetical protein